MIGGFPEKEQTARRAASLGFWLGILGERQGVFCSGNSIGKTSEQSNTFAPKNLWTAVYTAEVLVAMI